MLTDEFKREPRYVVLKISDLEKYCSPQARIRVGEVSNFIRHARRFDGRPDLECVVVESDWPEFEPTWAAIEARMTSRAIEAEVLQDCGAQNAIHAPQDALSRADATQAQEPVAWALFSDNGNIRIWTSASLEVKKLAEEQGLSLSPLYATPQPPAPCQCECGDYQQSYLEAQSALTVQNKELRKLSAECDALRSEVERLTTICADKDWYGIDALQAKVAEQAAKEFDWAKANAKCTDTIAQQAERIAELEKVAKAYEDQVAAHNKTLDEVARLSATIEKCEKALASAVEWGVPMRDAPKSSRPYWFDDSVTALAAIAAQKGGAA